MRGEGRDRGINYGSTRSVSSTWSVSAIAVRMRPYKLSAPSPKAGGRQLKTNALIEIEGEEKPTCIAEDALDRLRRLIHLIVRRGGFLA